VGDLVRIARKLEDRGVRFDMSIVGDGAERQHLESAIVSAGLDQRVRLTGSVDRARAVELCAGHDVFLLPSSYEGMPLSLLEAMGQGCIPVVRKSESGIPELISDGVNGIIVNGRDIDAFALSITRVAQDAELRRSMSARARDTTASGQFRLDVMLAKYAELVDRVAAEARAGTLRRKAAGKLCPQLSVRDVIAAPLWSMRPSMRAQQSLVAGIMRTGTDS
jgi:glycosyltransferase involved in cell wall biosynthesis